MNELAKVIEAAAAEEWRRIRATEKWIPNTEDVRSAFVVGFARGVHAGMTINLKRVAESVLEPSPVSQESGK